MGCWAVAAAAPPAQPSTSQELIHNAHFWEAHARGDLAQLALKKLVAARPDSPEALLELGELDLRLNEFTAAADVESELTHRFAGSPAAKAFATEYRVATRDRLQLASVHRLIDIGRGSESLASLKQLFPQGPPGGTLGIEYYLMLARTPGGLPSAYAGIRELARRHPDDPRYQLALAQLMVRQGDTALAGVRMLQQLSRRDDVRTEDVDRLLASGLLRLGAARAPDQLVSAYLAHHPDDAEVKALRNEQVRQRTEGALLSATTRPRVLPELQQRLSRDLSSGSGAPEARAQARQWLNRSRDSLNDRQELRAATELRAALAFYTRDYESEIGIAEDLDQQRLPAEAGELLEGAQRLAPQSTWLFETHIRSLIAHQQSASAIGLLSARAPQGKWTAQSRDKLLAAALEQRASHEADAGQRDAAAADLEAAVRLAPGDVWMRYRLAEDYRERGEPQRGRDLMSEGVKGTPAETDMRYAQALYLSHLEDYAAAHAAIDAIDPARRTPAMSALHDRMRVALARAEARRLKNANDTAGARAALLDVEPLASHSIDLAEQLAYSWIDLGSSEHGIGLIQPYLDGGAADDPTVLLRFGRVLNSAEDDARLGAALARLRAMSQLSPTDRAEVGRLQRALDLRAVRAIEQQRKFADAARRLDALLGDAPDDRDLRIRRAELYLRTDQPRVARDRYAALVAEDPDDLDTRLDYVRALTESGDTAMARSQLQAIEARMPPGNDELHIGLARRQLGLGAAADALKTLKSLLDAVPVREDVLMLAGRAELALRQFAQAREYFDMAAQSSNDAEALAARRESDQIADREASSVTAALIGRYQPGTAGMTQLTTISLPSSWLFAQDYESRISARADAVVVDAGHANLAGSALFGTVQEAAPGATLHNVNGVQAGVSPAVGYQADSLTADIGATPLGFLLPNVVGGIEWTPSWHSADLTFGVARRAVTSSELSYAGLTDPVTGEKWGGVVQTGPYAGFGIWRENYDVSGSVHLAEITGTHVLENQFAGLRLSGDRTLFTRQDLRAEAGVTVNYWNYRHDLSNYTFGSGGYYSPQSYVSVAAPLELSGREAGWIYKVRAGIAYSVAQVHSSPFYPNDPGLQAAAAHAPLPDGYSSPYFVGYRSSGISFSASAIAERQLNSELVVGAMLDIDRTDFYHPTTIAVYVRHAFAPHVTRSTPPPRPVQPYNPQ